MQFIELIEEVKAEIERAINKFPTWPTDPLHALAVLGEEYVELTKAMLQLTPFLLQFITKQKEQIV